MLVRLPPHFRSRRSATSRGESRSSSVTFTSELRRDLSDLEMVAYQKAVGGGAKRLIEFCLAALTFPIWCVAFFLYRSILKRRIGADPVIREEVTGYGGRAFTSRRFQVRRPSADIITLCPLPATAMLEAPLDGETELANEAPSQEREQAGFEGGGATRQATTRAFQPFSPDELLERLPMMFNVLGGQMSLVGPPCLSREQFKALRMARKFYASARPGIVQLCDPEAPVPVLAAVVRDYASLWSPSLDLQILRLALSQIGARPS